MSCWRWIAVLGLAMRSSRSKGLSVSTIEHGLFSFAGIMTIAAIGRTSNRSSSSIRPIDGICRNESRLGRDRMEETLLVESHTVLTTTVRRAIISRAANLASISLCTLS